MSEPRIRQAAPASDILGRAVEDRIRRARGQISPLYGVLLNSVVIADGWEQLLTAIRQKAELPARLRELIILRIAVLNQAEYEFEAHAPHALAAGLSQTQIDAVRAPAPDGFEKLERLVLAYTDAMTRDIQVPDALFAQIRGAFDPKLRVELTATIAAYNMVSRFLVALHVH